MLTPERIDPHDAEAFDAWYDAGREARDSDRPYPTSMAREELRVGATRPSEYYETGLWLVRDDDGEVAGTVRTSLPLKDNTAVLSFQLGVRPALRRRGAGTALLRVVEELAAERGRTTLQTDFDVPLEGSTAGQLFARSHGFTPANTEVHRVLELPLADSLLAELAAAAPATGYELVTWQDHCPDELVAAYAQLHAVFSGEVPLGELEWSVEVWDTARIRAREAHIMAQGRHTWVTVAVSSDGSLAGHSELLLPTLDPGNVYQWDTLVVPAHRGHGLGLAMKVRNHAVLQGAHPGPAVAHTWNAEQNDHMNAVNARLGYRPVELNQQWQRIT